MKIHCVKSARKDYPNEGIKKGEQYFYCEPKRKKAGIRIVRRKDKADVSKWITAYGKGFQGTFGSNMDEWRQRYENLYYEDERDELLAEVNDFLEEKKDSLENLPQQLQESHVLNEQIQELEDFVTELEEWEEEEHD